MSNDFNLNCPVPLNDHATVQMAHGGGGRLMRNLIESMFLPAFPHKFPSRSSPSPLSPLPSPPHDAAVLPTAGRGWLSPPTASSSTRCSFPAATSARWPSAEPSTIWRWPGPSRRT